MKNNRLYYVTAFFSGICIMGIEMSASRLLSPFFGSTNLIWSIIISLIMIGMGIGNYWGGYLADKYKQPKQLYTCLFAAGIWTILLPIVSNSVISGILFVSSKVFKQYAFISAAVISSIVLFMLPLILLGVCSPYLAKVCIKDLNDTGRVLGKIYLTNTIGSILGSLLPSFVLIPLIGVKKSFMTYAAILLIISIYFNIKNKIPPIKKTVTSVVVLLIAIATTTTGFNSTSYCIYETESAYNYLSVWEMENARALSTSLFFGVQSMNIDSEDRLTGNYWDYMLVLPQFIDQPEDENMNVLTIGYGTGTFPYMINGYYDNVTQTGVEIDNKVIDIANTYFGADESNCTLVLDDGRIFLSHTDEIYDIMLVDVYNDTSLPLNCTTKEFFDLCKSRLSDNGMVIMNIAQAHGSDKDMTQYISQTLHNSFDYVYYFDVPGGSNGILFAMNNPVDFNQYAASDLPPQLQDYFELIVGTTIQITEKDKLLTDDLNNMELIEQKALHDLLIEYFEVHDDIRL